MLARIDGLVTAFVDDVAGQHEHEAAVRRRLVDIAHLGGPEVIATSRTTARIAERAHDRGRTSAALAAGLRELHAIVEELDPAGPDGAEAYLERYARTRARVDDVLAELSAHVDALALALASRRQDERSLELETASLRRYAVMASRLDEALEARLAALALEDAARSARLRDDVLLPVRSRRRELLVHLEVATQSLLGLRAMDAHDETLREAVALVRTTTIAAIDTAAVVARMLAERRDRADLRDAIDDLRRSWREASDAIEAVDRAAG